MGGYVGPGGQWVERADTPAGGLYGQMAAVVSGGGILLPGGDPARVIKRFSDQVGVTVNNSGTASTATIDTASPFGGSALKLAIPVGNTRTDVKLTGLGLANFDDHIVWQIWVEDFTLVNQIAALAGTAGYSRFWQQLHTLANSSVNRVNGEQQISVGPLRCSTVNTFLAGADTLSDMEIRITPQGGGATNVWVRAVSVAKRGIPTFAITFDDASATWFPWAVTPLAAAGLPATFGVNSGDVNGGGNFVTGAQVAQLAQAGHQVSPHNVTNTAYNDGFGGTQTAAQYAADFVTCRGALGGWTSGAVDWSYHPWVQGKHGNDVIGTMRSYGMRIARSVDRGHNFYANGLGQHVNCLRTVYMDGSLMTLAQVLADIDAAAKYGTLCVLMAHDLVSGTAGAVQWNRDDFASVVAAVKTKVSAGARALTMSQVARLLYDQRLVASSLLADAAG